METKSTSIKSSVSTNNFIIIAALVSLLSIVGTLVLGRVLVNEALLNNRVIQAKSKAKTQLEANLAAIPQLQSNYAGLGSTLQVIKDALPATPDFPGLVSMVEAITNSSGMSLKSIAADQSGTTDVASGPTLPSGTGVQTSSFQIQVTGNYLALIQLVTNFQKSVRPMRVTGIALTGNNSALQATIKITTYHEPAVQIENKTEVIK